jgi:mannose-6-phosphate isomerase-like protein (cupin superfamily)
MTKALALFCLLGLPILLARSDEPLPEGFAYLSADSFRQLSKSMSKEAAADPHHASAHKLKEFPNEYFLLAVREGDGVPELHETEADVFVVLSGSASLLVGGKLVNGEKTAPHEFRNGTIQGAARQKLSTGDVVRIPPRMPHQLLLDSGSEFEYFVVKVKGY